MRINKRTVWIDFIRSVCIIWVICIHLTEYVGINISAPGVKLFTKGCMGAMFALSGYNLRNYRFETRNDFFQYYRRRFIRVYPLFALVSFCFYALYRLINVSYISSIRQLGLTLIGAAGIYSKMPATLWFLVVLMCFYFMTPLIAEDTCGKTLRNAGMLFFFLYVLYRLGSLDIRYIYYFPLFVAGLCVGKFANAKLRNAVSKGGLLACILVFIVLNTAGIGYIQGSELLQYLQVIVAEVVITWMIVSVAQLPFPQVVNSVIRQIGYSSMCVYLFHRVFFSIAKYYCGVLPKTGSYLLGIPILVIICWGIQRLYDLAVTGCKK